MSTSEWISISGIAGGLFAAITGSTWYLASSISGLHGTIGRLDQRLMHVEDNLKKLADGVAQMRIEMNVMQGDIRELQVKVDILWKQHHVLWNHYIEKK